MAQQAPSFNVNSYLTITGASSFVIPSGVNVGEYMTLHLMAPTGTAAPAAPSGWTQFYEGSSGGGPAFGIFWKKAVAGDPGSTVTLSGAGLYGQFESVANVGADPTVVSVVKSATATATSIALSPNSTSGGTTYRTIETWVVQAANDTTNPTFTSTDTVLNGTTVASGTVSGTNYRWGLAVSHRASTTLPTGTFSISPTSASMVAEVVSVVYPPIQPPAAPTLTTPANAASVDVSGGVTFGWTYNPNQGDGSQNNIEIRQKVSGAPSYSYWNRSTGAWQSSGSVISCTTNTFTLPAGALSDGNTYNWSVETEESRFLMWGAFATDSTFNAVAPPTISISAPAGTIASTTPTVTASVSMPSGEAMSSYRVVVYTAAQVAAPGFSPGVTTGAIYDSGTVSSTSSTISQPVSGLSNNVTYYAYVQATESGSISSSWVSSAFTVSFDPPATPSLAVTPSTSGLPEVTLAVTGHDNMLGATDASFEGSTGSWAASVNCSLSASTAASDDGSYSLALTATAAGTVLSNGAGGNPVTPGQTYTALASFKAGSTPTNVSINLIWIDGSGAEISQVNGPAAPDNASGWAQVSASGVAPAGAATAMLQLEYVASAAGEVHYVDEAGFFSGTVSTWSRGGLVGSTVAIVERSDDGGTTWAPIRGSGASLGTGQAVTFVDTEAPINPATPSQYRAFAEVTLGVGAVLESSAATASTSLPASAWWIHDPTDPSLAVELSALKPAATKAQAKAPAFEIDRTRAQTVLRPFGRAKALVQRGDTYDPEFTLSFTTLTAADNAATVALYENGRTVLVRSDIGDCWYVDLGPSDPSAWWATSDRLTNPVWDHAFTCTVVEAP